MISKKGTLIKEDLKKLGIGLLIAAAGGIATYLEKDVLNLFDFGQLEPLAYAVNSLLVNAIRKLISENNYA